MKTPVFTGAATALVTPYDENGVDHDLLTEAIDRQIGGGVAAIAVCATTGEAPVLSERERTMVIAHSVRQAAGKLRVIVGVGGNDTESAAMAAREAEILGADAVMLTAPYYNKATEEGLYRHFTAVADRVGIPLIVYNVPGRTAVACKSELYERLAEHPNVNGVKEASGDISLVSDTIRRCADALNVWSGNDDQTLPMMALGARGVISVASNLTPEAITALCRACLEGDYARAREIHEKYSPLFDVLFREVNPIPVKTALAMIGLDRGLFRLPLCPMSEGHRSELEKRLRALSLIP